MKRIFKNKTVAGGNVQLTSFSPLMVEKTITDSLGRFCFERLFLKDSAEVKLTGVNEKEGKGVLIIPDKAEQPDTLVLPASIDCFLAEIGIPMKYARENYLKRLAWQDFDPDKGSILLEGVNISAKSKNTIKQVDFYKPYFYNVDNSYLITPADYKYKSTANFLFEKAQLPINEWRMHPTRGTFRAVQYYLDGKFKLGFDPFDEGEQVLSIPIKNVFQIDVDKTIPWIYAIVFVYTKKFELSTPSALSIRGNAILNVQGFQKPKKFYSPTYTTENINLIMMDYRPTLYWSPEVVVKDGKAVIDFFTCDNLSNYVVIVEGISKNGKICFGARQFTVNTPRGN